MTASVLHVEHRALPIHPAAETWPMMSKDELRLMAADILERGLIHPVVLFDGAVLDGRNRLAACDIAGVTPTFTELKECRSPTGYILSANKHRRHLSKSQLAMIAERTLPFFEAEAKERQRLSEGRGVKGPEIVPDLLGDARDKAAEAVGVNPRYVSDAKDIRSKSPKVAKLVEQGKVSLRAAKSLVEMDEGQQEEVVKRVRAGEDAKKVMGQVNRKKTPEQKAEAQARRDYRACAKALRAVAKRFSFMRSHKRLGPIIGAISELPQ